MATRNRATRKRTGNNTLILGGILGLMDGNAPSLRRQTITKTAASPSSVSSHNSSSSSSCDDSISHTPPFKTLLCSTLAGSPLTDNQVQEEEEMSDLSVGTLPSNEESSSNEKKNATPESDYSLKSQPLYLKENECAAYGADDESSNDNDSQDDDSDNDDDSSTEDGNESNVIDYENVYTPDSRRTSTSSVDSDANSSQDNNNDDNSLDSIGLSGDQDSVQEEEEAFSEESDDEYVMEESSSDTQDEDLDADIVVDWKSKQPRGRKKTSSASAKPKKASSTHAPQSPHQSNTETQNVNHQNDDDDDDETVPEDDDEEEESKVSPVIKPKPRKARTARKIPVLAIKNVNTLQRKKTTKASSTSTNKQDKSPLGQDKKASIYAKSRELSLSTHQEMVVVAQVLEGINLDNDDDVVIAEVVTDGDAHATDDLLATVVVDDDTETVQQDHEHESRDYSDSSDAEEAASLKSEHFEEQSNNDDEQSFAMSDELEPLLDLSNESIVETTIEPLPDIVVPDENESIQGGASRKEDEFELDDLSGLPDETTTIAAVPSLSAIFEGIKSGDEKRDATTNALCEIPLTSPSINDESSVPANKFLASNRDDSTVDEWPPTESRSPLLGEAFDNTSAHSESMGHEPVASVTKAMKQSPIQSPLSQNKDGIDEEISASPQIQNDSTSTDKAAVSSFVLDYTRTHDVGNGASEKEAQVEVMTLLPPSEDCQIDTAAASKKDTNETTETEKSPPKGPFISKSCNREEALEESVPIVAATRPSTDDDETGAPAEPDRRPRLRRFRSEGSIKRGKWGTGSKIGVGSFGVVRVGMNKKTGTLMAVKSISVSAAVMKDIQTEIDLLKSLDHINIVRYLGAETDEKYLHIFQEWVPGGSVTSLLHKFGPFTMQVIRSYLFQILSGLSYLHDNRILHRDIKGGNVLVSDAGVVKLADFGSSKRLVQQQIDAMENLTMRGTPYFMAPEVFEEKYGSKADIWSVGCVAFQMATGSPPWKGMGFTNPMTLFLHIKDTEGIPRHEWSNPDQDDIVRFKAMLKKCFYRDPSARPTAKELAADPFFTASEQSSSEDNQSRGLFSPGGDSISTWGSARSPKPSLARSSPASQPAGVTFGKASFLSPPLPTRIHQGTHRQDVISPLAPSPVVDASEWPSWARERLQDRKSPYKMRPENEVPVGGGGLPPPSPSKLADSLAVSEDSSILNPFRRKGRKSGDSSLGTADSLAVSEDSSMVNPFRRKGRMSGDSSLASSLEGLHFLEGKSEEGTADGKLS